MSSDSKGKILIAFMCIDDRHSPDCVKEELRENFPDMARRFILTSPGGNYSLDYPDTVETILMAGYELAVVVLGKHKAIDCAAAAAGTRMSRAQAYERVRSENQKLGVKPKSFVANICTHTSKFTKLQQLDENLLYNSPRVI